jgi:Ca-activated chloride channel homolog
MFFPHLAVWIMGAKLLAGGPPAAPTRGSAAATLPATSITLQRRVEEVQVIFTVREGRRLVQDLSRDQLTVLDNGQRPAAVTAFQQDSSLPLRVALVVDHSDSMQKGFAGEQQVAREFLGRFLRPNLDSVFLVDFSTRATVRPVSLGNSQSSTVNLDNLEASGQTALYDAMLAASRRFEDQSADLAPVRRVMILLSDGEDNFSRASLAEAIEAAQRNDIAVYVVTAHNSHYEYQGDAVLRRIADSTGGRAFILKSYDGAAQVFREIEGELRTQYSMTFRPPNPRECGYHTIRIVPRDGKLRIRARDGYYACSE